MKGCLVSISTDELIKVISETLIASNKGKPLSSEVTVNSKMNDPREWDSLAFVSVFLGVNEAFDLDADDDDAIHFMSVQQIMDFANQ